MMNKDRQKELQQLMDAAFTAISALDDKLTGEDLKWADKNWEKNDFAAELANLGENLIDWGKQFR